MKYEKCPLEDFCQLYKKYSKHLRHGRYGSEKGLQKIVYSIRKLEAKPINLKKDSLTSGAIVFSRKEYNCLVLNYARKKMEKDELCLWLPTKNEIENSKRIKLST